MGPHPLEPVPLPPCGRAVVSTSGLQHGRLSDPGAARPTPRGSCWALGWTGLGHTGCWRPWLTGKRPSGQGPLPPAAHRAVGPGVQRPLPSQEAGAHSALLPPVVAGVSALTMGFPGPGHSERPSEPGHGAWLRRRVRPRLQWSLPWPRLRSGSGTLPARQPALRAPDLEVQRQGFEVAARMGPSRASGEGRVWPRGLGAPGPPWGRTSPLKPTDKA